MNRPAPLARSLGLGDAIAIGLGSMLGAGVFAAFAPAAGVAGSAMLLGLALAAVVAFANATSSAQLAAQYPDSGGTYVYGRERLGPWPGFAAGWFFVVGKLASCAAMALTFAAYVAPSGWEKPFAVGAVLVLTAVNYVGVTRTAALTKIIVAVVIAVLGLVAVAAFVAAPSDGGKVLPGLGFGEGGPVTGYAVLQSAGLLFFAFAGYARIATLGEEVRRPERTIPSAITIALTATLLIYAVLAVAALAVLGPERLADSSDPLRELAAAGGWDWTAPLVQIGAAAASLGALLALIAGISRTSLAMSRNGDLPRILDAVHPRFRVPHRAELAAAAVVCALVLAADLRSAIGFSSFGVLLYYFVANVSAFTQDHTHRRYPRALAVVGAVGCLVLVATLPWHSILAGVLVGAVGFAYRAVVVRAND
ncbi:APC family permease [Dietzia timorensis]|uniref:Putative transporter n=1 Tax=Dietzia timorensis TaxID=499555 RepID=A0A173LP75_9ACTN|nr:APC family permease [Dietzia timorensis]ANI94076.1 putative transporter [Dietzia timorensis]